MKIRFILISTLLLSIFAFLWNALINLVILRYDNKSIELIHRSDMADKLWISIIVTIFISLLFTISYLKWRKTGTTLETITHSLFFTVLMGIVVDLNQYVQYAIPFSLIIKWFIFGIAEFILYGLILNFLYNRIKSK
ncbi:MAG TPA: hypothetical protein VIK14_13340 [Ignavibacteria bacterium]